MGNEQSERWWLKAKAGGRSPVRGKSEGGGVESWKVGERETGICPFMPREAQVLQERHAHHDRRERDPRTHP